MFQRSSDSLTAFLTEMAIFDKTSIATRTAAYECYKNYCDVLGLFAVSEQKFTGRLKETPKVSPTTVSTPSRLRAWRGIVFKTIDDDGVVSVPQVSQVSDLGMFTPAESHNSKNIQEENSDTSDTSDTTKQLKVVVEKSSLKHKEVTCGDCGKFQLPSCSYPGDFEKVAADHWAGDCRYFIKKQAEMPNFDDKEP